jgi:serine/threonine-protein phosphatase 2A regulatory subunit B''
MNGHLFAKADPNNTGQVNRAEFTKFWRAELENCEISKRLFKTIGAWQRKYLLIEDFKPLLRILLDKHPGLEFL